MFRLLFFLSFCAVFLPGRAIASSPIGIQQSDTAQVDFNDASVPNSDLQPLSINSLFEDTDELAQHYDTPTSVDSPISYPPSHSRDMSEFLLSETSNQRKDLDTSPNTPTFPGVHLRRDSEVLNASTQDNLMGLIEQEEKVKNRAKRRDIHLADALTHLNGSVVDFGQFLLFFSVASLSIGFFVTIWQARNIKAAPVEAAKRIVRTELPEIIRGERQKAARSTNLFFLFFVAICFFYFLLVSWFSRKK